MRSLGSKLSGIHRVVELPLLCFDATARRHSMAINVPRPLRSLISQRFTCHAACFSLSRWHLAAGHATACPVHKTKHGRCAALLCHTGEEVSCCHAAGCCTYFCFCFCFCFCRCLRSGLCYQQSSFRIPFSRIPYAICRVPFPDLCNSMHVPHFCCKTCRTCRMWLCHTAATKIPQKVPQTRHVKHVWHELYGELH